MSSYPNLVPITPIHGVLYKAKTVNRPHPEIIVMPIKEVIMHQKRESVAVVMPEESQKDLFFHLKKKKKRTKKSRNEARASYTMAPEYREEFLDSASILKSLEGYDEYEEKKANPFRRLKSALKKTLQRIIPATKSHNEPHNPPISKQHHLNSGFYCSQNRCANCSPSRPPTPTTVPQVDLHPLHDTQHRQNGLNTKILQPFPHTASFSSGSTYTSSTPTTADLDIFHDFNGVHIELTPPRLAPMRPVSRFEEELQGTMSENWMDTDSSDDGNEGDLEDTFLTTSDVQGAYMPEVSSTLGSEEQGGCEDPATPCPKDRYCKREGGGMLLVMEKVGEETLEAVLSSGAAAQRRRSSRA